MSEKWTGTSWCDKCQQLVDVYSEDNETFTCGFCGNVIAYQPCL